MVKGQIRNRVKRLLGIDNARRGVQQGPSQLNAQPVDEVVDGARKAMTSRLLLGERTQNAMDAFEPTTTAAKRVYNLWAPLLQKVNVFVVLVDNMAEIHPYAKIAATVLLAGVKVVTTQAKRDKDMDNLLEAMNSLYELVMRAKDLRDMDENRKQLLKVMSLQTIQCAYFIRDQAELKSFWRRAVANAIMGSGVDSKMSEFTQAFVDIRRCFTERGVLEGEIRLVKILDLGLNIQATIDLMNLVCIRGAGLDSSRGCLPGTRVNTLDDFASWVNDADMDAPRVRFLLGGAGTGKSSVAHSIGTYFHELKRLGSFIRFDRSSRNDRSPRDVIRTIARDLADWDPVFRQALASAIQNDRELERSVDMAQQWKGLILEPLKTVTLVGPVVVVIDAFDECSSPDSPERSQLLRLLTEGSKTLPPNFRILITSRPEHDVMRIVHTVDHSHFNHISLDTRKEEAMLDIERYVRHQLAPDSSDDALDDDDIQLVVTKAEGLFQWAATACMLVSGNAAGITLKERFDSRLGAILGGGTSSLDELYRSILQQAFKLDEPIVARRFRSVMAQLFCASSPLSINSLNELRRLATGVQKDEVTLILQHLGPLLSGISDRASPVLPLHTSFRDFLTDESRSREWFVNVATGNAIMALACFRLMNQLLRFNICLLETSYLRNRDILDLDTRLSQSVSQGLSYATCNWKDHLTDASPSDLRKELEIFLREKLLFWFELLSLLKCANRAASSLQTALQVFKDTLGGSSKELLRDAISFARRFAGVMAQATPHIYLSALAFSPAESSVRANWLPDFPWLPVVIGIHDDWPQAQAVLTGHATPVCSVTYSPDGRHIASGAYDDTVRIWDAETGETTHTLSCGSPVFGVAFSPDGGRIAVALQSGTVSLWNITTWETVQTFSCKSEVLCVVYSPDGNFVATSDDKGCIDVWSSATFELVHQLIHGKQHVLSIAFSPNGRYIVSGSKNRTVQISDTIDGQAVGALLEGHTRQVTSVLFSLDGRHIVSGSLDSTIQVWNFKTRQALKTIPVSNEVWSLSLSPDGKRIASGLRDGGVLICDAETYQLIGGPYVGHTLIVMAVGFSPDGRHVVSGSADGTLRLWSVEAISGVVSPGQSESTVTALAYSPDGSRLVTGSSDGTIGLWVVGSGKSIRSWDGHSTEVSRVRISPDGGHFVSASNDHTVCVWDLATLRPHGERLRGHSSIVMDVDYSPDGSRIVSCSADQTLRIWDAGTSDCLLGPLKGHRDCVLCIAWSPSGKQILSGSADKTLLLWDAETGCVVGEPFRGHIDWVRSVSWSKDGNTVVSSDDSDTMIVWNLESRAPTCQHLHAGWRFIYSPGYQWILSGAVDGTITLRDAQTQEPIGASLCSPFGQIWQLAFSPDGRRIASISRGDQTLSVVWDIHTLTDPSGTHPSFTNLISAPTASAQDLPQISQDGWVTDADGNLIIWVPDEYRASLVWRGMLYTIPEKQKVTIDFAYAHYGRDWAGCYQEHHS